jgi:hypothetical protein
MSPEHNRTASEQSRGADLADTAEALLAEAQLDSIDPAHAVQLATAHAMLALYWEVRQVRTALSPRDPVPPAAGAARCRRYRRERATEPGA